MTETWKEIKEFPDYEVSTNGRIRIKTTGKIRRFQLSEGYPAMDFRISRGKNIYKRIHRIVAKTFIENTGKLPLVLHRDGDRANNKIDNLYWGTYSQNMKDSLNQKRHPIGSTAYNAKLTEEVVIYCREQFYNKGASCVSLAKTYGVSPPALHKAIMGKTWKHV